MKKVTFDLVSALNLISVEEDLATTFNNKFPNESFPKLISTAEKGKLSKEKSDFVKGLFDNVILKRNAFVDKYGAYASKSASVPAVKSNSKKSTQGKLTLVENKGVFSTETVPTSVGVDPKAKLPKEYNKTRVMEDIAARGGGKPTEFEQAVLDLNDLKNMYYKLNAKCNRQRYRGSKELSDVDCRDISASISTITKKLKHLLK